MDTPAFLLSVSAPSLGDRVFDLRDPLAPPFRTVEERLAALEIEVLHLQQAVSGLRYRLDQSWEARLQRRWIRLLVWCRLRRGR